MAVRVDSDGAAAMVSDPGNSAAKPQVRLSRSAERAVFDLTRGAKAIPADSGNAPGDLVDRAAIKMKGKVRVETDSGSVLRGTTLGIIQIANLIVHEHIWAGRLPSEGGIRVLGAAKFSKNPCVDSTAGFAPFTRPLSSTSDIVSSGSVGAVDFLNLECLLGTGTGTGADKDGDHPSGGVPLKVQNGVASEAINFLFSLRIDLGMTTALVARAPGPGGSDVITTLAHIGWHAIWHTQFRWKGTDPRPTVVPVNNRLDIGVSVHGAPSDATIAGLITSAAAPFYNDQAVQSVTDFAARGSSRVQTATRPPEVPADFFT